MKKVLIILIVLSVIAFGCEENTQTPLTTTPYIGGDEGVKMSFIQGMPPDYVFDNSGYEFGIGVQIENLGEDDVEPDQMYIEIQGINPSDFSVGSQSELKKSPEVELPGARKNFEGTAIPGGRDVVEFNGLNYAGDLKGNAGIKIRAEMCYEYQTYTSTTLCIKKDILENIGSDKICDLSGDKNPHNSGAPVHITSLKETPMGKDKIQIAFVIDNVRSPEGIIFKDGAECDDSITNQDINKVWVEVATDINGNKAQCNGLSDASSDGSSGFVTLYGGEPRTVTCTLNVGSIESIFEKVFDINLKYNYMQYIERPLEIRDVSTE